MLKCWMVPACRNGPEASLSSKAQGIHANLQVSQGRAGQPAVQANLDMDHVRVILTPAIIAEMILIAANFPASESRAVAVPTQGCC